MNDEIKVAGTHADCPGQTGQDTHGTPASWKHSVPGHPVPFPALAPTLRCSHHTSRDVSPLAWSLQWLGLSSLVAPPLAWLAPPRARFLLWCGPFLRSYSQPERVVPRGSVSGLWSSGSAPSYRVSFFGRLTASQAQSCSTTLLSPQLPGLHLVSLCLELSRHPEQMHHGSHASPALSWPSDPHRLRLVRPHPLRSVGMTSWVQPPAGGPCRRWWSIVTWRLPSPRAPASGHSDFLEPVSSGSRTRVHSPLIAGRPGGPVSV